VSKKAANPYADTEFVRSFHVERRECEAAYGVSIVTSITTAVRPDRVQIRHEAYDTTSPRGEVKPMCSYVMDWPNESAMSFSAALFRSAVSLTRLVQDSCADLWRDTLRAQGKRAAD